LRPASKKDRQARASQAVDAIEAFEPDLIQEGELPLFASQQAAYPRTLCSVKLDLHHVSNISKLLSHLSKHHVTVAEEDVDHAAAALDIYRHLDRRLGLGHACHLPGPEIAVCQRPDALTIAR